MRERCARPQRKGAPFVVGGSSRDHSLSTWRSTSPRWMGRIPFLGFIGRSSLPRRAPGLSPRHHHSGLRRPVRAQPLDATRCRRPRPPSSRTRAASLSTNGTGQCGPTSPSPSVPSTCEATCTPLHFVVQRSARAPQALHLAAKGGHNGLEVVHPTLQPDGGLTGSRGDLCHGRARCEATGPTATAPIDPDNLRSVALLKPDEVATGSAYTYPKFGGDVLGVETVGIHRKPAPMLVNVSPSRCASRKKPSRLDLVGCRTYSTVIVHAMFELGIDPSFAVAA